MEKILRYPHKNYKSLKIKKRKTQVKKILMRILSLQMMIHKKFSTHLKELQVK